MSNINYSEQESMVLLSEQVVYNPRKRTLSRGKNIINLSENESCLLKLLLIKTNSKREVMHEIWEKRGTIVTESSYYKLVRQLRQSFKKIDLDENLIMTLPRVGILYTGEKSEIPELSKYATRKNLYTYIRYFLQKTFSRSSL
ncbi:TPA: transcriptional regulator [Providencia rettgeri]